MRLISFLASSCIAVAVRTPTYVLAATSVGASPVAPVWPVAPNDATVNELVAQTLARLPEIKASLSNQRAEAARVDQVGAWPDPMLELGIQNDGFSRIEVGNMESSYYSFMVQQQIPWPGKRALSKAEQLALTRRAEQAVMRERLDAEARVRSSYVDLLTVRARLGLLSKTSDLWSQSVATARARYQATLGSQTDVLRAQLEAMRIKQQLEALRGEEQSTSLVLNRWRGRAPGDPIDTPASLPALAGTELPTAQAAIDDALTRSPELLASRFDVAAAEQRTALAHKGYYPDLALKAGIMYRGQQLPPMWLFTVAVPLPVFASRKQRRDVESTSESETAMTSLADAQSETLRLRVSQRLIVLNATLATLRVYDQGLLAQSAAAAESTSFQYRVGKVGFAAVLAANAAYLADADGYLRAQASAYKTLIAAAAVSRDAPSSGDVSSFGGSAIPGADATPSAPASGKGTDVAMPRAGGAGM